MPQQFIAIEILVLGSLSIIGCSFVIFCYLKFNELRTDQLKIVINIIIYDLIQQWLLFSSAAGFLAIDDEDFELSTYPIICYGEAVLLQFSLISSTAWTTIISNNLYRTVKYGDPKYHKMPYLLVGVLFPLLMSLFDEDHLPLMHTECQQCFLQVCVPSIQKSRKQNISFCFFKMY